MAEEAVNPANGGVIETVDANATYKHYSNGGNQRIELGAAVLVELLDCLAGVFENL